MQTLDQVDVAICGVPFDTGASFKVGARFGPNHIRSAAVLLRPYNPELDVNLAETISAVDYGDAPVVPGYIDDSYERIEAFLAPIFARGVRPLILGGDHSVSLPNLRAAARTYGPLAMVHFDSHSDTWDSYFGRPYNHGTPFRRAVEEGILDPARSIQIGLRGPLYSPDDLDDARGMGFTLITAAEMRRIGLEQVLAEIRRVAGGSRPVYCSFDIDFLDPAFAPGTGTPEAGGPATWEALQLVRGLRGLPLIGADLVEVLPALDPAGVTAHAAAAMGYELVSLFALEVRAGRERGGADGPAG